MRRTLRNILNHAVKAYDDKPRESWIFDYPAQLALVGTQIWWAVEVEISFSKIEEGYENAMKEYQKKQVRPNPLTETKQRKTEIETENQVQTETLA